MLKIISRWNRKMVSCWKDCNCAIGFLSGFYCLLLVTYLNASDMKIKLNSADGSTSFQVRDSADVVVSTITSKGQAHFGGTGDYSVKSSSGIQLINANSILDFPAGAITDKTVKNEDLIIVSTFVSGNVTGIAENTSFADLNPFYATLNVTQQPALVYGYFTAISSRTDGSYDCTQYKMIIDGNDAGFDGFVTDGGQGATDYGASVVGIWRVTTTGSKVVKVQQWHWGTADIKNCRFSAFWVPCSP